MTVEITEKQTSFENAADAVDQQLSAVVAIALARHLVLRVVRVFAVFSHVVRGHRHRARLAALCPIVPGSFLALWASRHVRFSI